MTRFDDECIAVFHASIDRLHGDPEFLDRFYERFMGVSEDIAAVFQGRDMPRIKRKLRLTLNIITMLVDDEPGMDWYMTSLADIHNQLEIPPVFFELWKDALVETVAEHDPAFDEQVRSAWSRVLDQAIAAMRIPSAPEAPA